MNEKQNHENAQSHENEEHSSLDDAVNEIDQHVAQNENGDGQANNHDEEVVKNVTDADGVTKKDVVIAIVATAVVVGGSAYFFLGALGSSKDKESTREEQLQERIAQLEKKSHDAARVQAQQANANNTGGSESTSGGATTQEDVSAPGIDNQPKTDEKKEEKSEKKKPSEPIVSEFHTVKDKGENFSLDVPGTWRTGEKEGSAGVQHSRTVVSSQDFSSHTDPNFQGPFEPVYYDTGAMLTVHVTDEVGGTFTIINGNVLQKFDDNVDGKDVAVFVYTEPSTFAGQIIETLVTKSGKSYSIRYVFNESTHAGGKDEFKAILDSFEFL